MALRCSLVRATETETLELEDMAIDRFAALVQSLVQRESGPRAQPRTRTYAFPFGHGGSNGWGLSAEAEEEDGVGQEGITWRRRRRRRSGRRPAWTRAS